MTAEGVFPKIAGDIAYASEANDTVKGSGLGIIFKNLSEHIVGGTTWLNSSFNSTPTADSTSEITTPFYPHYNITSGTELYWVHDGAISTGEGGVVTIPTNGADITMSGASAYDFNTATGSKWLQVDFVGAGAGGAIFWYLTDGSAEVQIADSVDNTATYTIQTWGGSVLSTSYSPYGNLPTGTLNASKMWALRFKRVDLRSITTSAMRYLPGSNIVQSFKGAIVSTPGSLIKDAILCGKITQGTGATGSFYLSANSGTNWELPRLNQVHNFTNTGSCLRIRVDLNATSSNTITTLNNYSVMYNCGFNS